MTSAAMPVFCYCSFSIISNAHGESDLTPIEVEGYRDQTPLNRCVWHHVPVPVKLRSCRYSEGNGKVSPAAEKVR